MRLVFYIDSLAMGGSEVLARELVADLRTQLDPTVAAINRDVDGKATSPRAGISAPAGFPVRERSVLIGGGPEEGRLSSRAPQLGLGAEVQSERRVRSRFTGREKLDKVAA
jgi:hypothetical protein